MQKNKNRTLQTRGQSYFVCRSIQGKPLAAGPGVECWLKHKIQMFYYFYVFFVIFLLSGKPDNCGLFELAIFKYFGASDFIFEPRTGLHEIEEEKPASRISRTIISLVTRSSPTTISAMIKFLKANY
jgi:hypothetical protein